MNESDHILAKEIRDNKTPSVQYYFFTPDTVLKSVHMGFADIDGQKKVDEHTTYNAFSVTKTFTALAILQLVDSSKINLDSSVIQYLPEFPYGAEISVRHLLTHTAGIPNPIPLAWIHLESDHPTFDPEAFFQPIFNKNIKVKSSPNEKFNYSNLGYVVLGQLIERVSGKTYEDYIKENIINRLPIDPGDLSFEAANKEQYAKGYQKRMSFSNFLLGFFIDKATFMGKPEGKWRPFNSYYVNGAPYGGLVGSATSFVKYIQELMQEHSVLISETHKSMLFVENKNNKGDKTGMCLAWFSGELAGNKYFTHAGGGGGYYCEIRIYPELKMGSVIFFNRTGMTDERFLDKLDIHFMR